MIKGLSQREKNPKTNKTKCNQRDRAEEIGDAQKNYMPGPKVFKLWVSFFTKSPEDYSY